jgi:hypothetical protein
MRLELTRMRLHAGYNRLPILATSQTQTNPGGLYFSILRPWQEGAGSGR